MEDGTELPADLVVYATGYNSMNGWAAELISQEVADTVGKVWGLGSDTTKDPGPWEGEQRNMWKPTQQDGLWFHGGNLHQSRHYSLYLALQLKARAGGHRHARLRATGGAPPSVTSRRRWMRPQHDPEQHQRARVGEVLGVVRRAADEQEDDDHDRGTGITLGATKCGCLPGSRPQHEHGDVDRREDEQQQRGGRAGQVAEVAERAPAAWPGRS